MHNMVRDPSLPGWMTSTVKEQKPPFLTVLIEAGETKTVVIARMQVLFATPRWLQTIRKMSSAVSLSYFSRLFNLDLNLENLDQLVMTRG